MPSTIPLPRREPSVQECLKKPSRREGVELLHLPLARDFFAPPLPLDQPLLGIEAAQALVDKYDGPATTSGQRAPPLQRHSRRRTDAVVHVQGKPEHEPLHSFLLNDLHHLVGRLLRRADCDHLVRRSKPPALVTEGEAN